ncbi:hypothetical protein [Paraburkholderia haematera]|uniref:hypothetical protein n=1 Tax=Paraburkholderia haematera TaxID=2793077 RepID=UPI001B8C5043|nr:hypothetical protein [Paraburkholderia haematera]
MEIDIVKADVGYLRCLRTHILSRKRSRLVIDVEPLLMKGLADAIAAEHRRSNVIDGDLSDCDLLATVNFKIRPCPQGPTPKPAKKRELSSLLAELDDALTSKASKDLSED